MADLTAAATPILEEPDGAFSDDGVDLTLIRWMLSLTPSERLAAAQSMVALAFAARRSVEPVETKGAG